MVHFVVQIRHASLFNSLALCVLAFSKPCKSLWSLFAILCRSKDFRPAYSCLAELRAFVPPGTPLMACTATATKSIHQEVVSSLEMTDYVKVSHSPDRPNIFYAVQPRNDVDTDFFDLLGTLREKLDKTPRVIVYCRSLNMCSALFAHFHYELGAASYYPPGSPEISENRLFGMYHGSTPQHNKDVIVQSLLDPSGVVRVIFATIALGMGVDLQGVDTIVHYGAPASIEDYFQESGRGERSGGAAKSIVYWKPSDCPRVKDPSTLHQKEGNDVRAYVENSTLCRRKWLLEHFAPECAKSGRDPSLCCDVCAARQ